MRVGIALIEIDRLERGLHSLLQLKSGVLCPAIGNDPATDPGEPDVRLRQLGIEFAGLAKQLSRFEMVLARHLMEMPGAATYQVPRRHVAGMPGRGLGPFNLEQLRLDGAGNALGDRILNGEEFCQLKVVAFRPDMITCRSIDQLRGNANELAGLTQASLQQITN